MCHLFEQPELNAVQRPSLSKPRAIHLSRGHPSSQLSEWPLALQQPHTAPVAANPLELCPLYLGRRLEVAKARPRRFIMISGGKLRLHCVFQTPQFETSRVTCIEPIASYFIPCSCCARH
jgi:hypothetical protein